MFTEDLWGKCSTGSRSREGEWESHEVGCWEVGESSELERERSLHIWFPPLLERISPFLQHYLERIMARCLIKRRKLKLQGSQVRKDPCREKLNNDWEMVKQFQGPISRSYRICMEDELASATDHCNLNVGFRTYKDGPVQECPPVYSKGKA